MVVYKFILWLESKTFLNRYRLLSAKLIKLAILVPQGMNELIKMAIYNVDPTELIKKAAEELKKIDSIKPPSWAGYIKTGVHKERPPVDKDWWYTRAASVLRKVYLAGPIGVSKLRIKYGGKKRRGYKTAHFYKASGSIIRKILQQLEKAELLKKSEKDVHKGRIITAKGKSFLNQVAVQLGGEVRHEKVKERVKTEEKEEPKKVKEKIPKAEKPIKKTKRKYTKAKKEEKISAVEKLVKEAKEHAKGKKPSAEELLKSVPEEKKEKVPTAQELSEKKAKNG